MKLLITIICSAFISACTSSSDFRAGEGGTAITLSSTSYKTVFNNVIHALQKTTSDRSIDFDKGLNIDKQSYNDGIIEASSASGLAGYGEAVAVFIIPPHDNINHRIEVHSAPVLATNITATDWEDRVIHSIKNEFKN